MRVKKAARNSGNYSTPYLLSLAKKDRYSIPDEWERGTRNAGILLVLMFVVLSFGTVVFGW